MQAVLKERDISEVVNYKFLEAWRYKDVPKEAVLLLREYLQSHYRFNELELKEFFGSYKDKLISSRLLNIDNGKNYYYCPLEILQEMFDGLSDPCLFLPSCSLKELQSILPDSFDGNKQSKGEIITDLVRNKDKFYSEIQNLTDKELDVLRSEMLKLKKFICLKYHINSNIAYVFDSNMVENFYQEFPSLVGKNKRPYSYGFSAADITIFFSDVRSLAPELFQKQYLFNFSKAHSSFFSLCIHPLLHKKLLDQSKKKALASLKLFQSNVPSYKSNPSSVRYHESTASLERIFCYFNMSIESQDIGMTQNGTHKVADLKKFWKKIFDRKISDFEHLAYDQISVDYRNCLREIELRQNSSGLKSYARASAEFRKTIAQKINL